MIRKDFDTCLYYLVPSRFRNESLCNEVITKPSHTIPWYITPFRRELALNLLNCNNTVQLRTLIKIYIDELSRVKGELPGFEELLIESTEPTYKIGYKNLENFQNQNDYSSSYRHYLYVLVFDEIQLLCIIHKIPFLKICKEVNFPINIIDIKISYDPLRKRSQKADNLIQSSKKPQIKPVFEPGKIVQIIDILESYFDKKQQKKLRTIISNGGIVSTPLLFKDSGARFADFIKQLYNVNIIKGCSKIVLEKWVGKNFTFLYRGKVKEFTSKYLNYSISTTSEQIKCKRPLIEITTDMATGEHFIVKK